MASSREMASVAALLEEPPGLALVPRRRQQEELGRDELVAALGGFLVGEVQQPVEVPGDGEVALVALDLRHALDRVLEPLLQGRGIGPGALEDGRGAAVLLVEECEQQVLGLDEAVVAGERQALGVGQRLLEFGGQFVDAHGVLRPLSGVLSA
jgi:hypothetical protein